MLIMNITGYVLFGYLLGVKLPWGHAHKTSTPVTFIWEYLPLGGGGGLKRGDNRTFVVSAGCTVYEPLFLVANITNLLFKVQNKQIM